jgi:hypothetical protein
VNVDLPKELVEKIGAKKLATFGVTEESTRWNDVSIGLHHLDTARLAQLQVILTPFSKQNAKGARVALRDLLVWKEALTGSPARIECKTAKHFAMLLFAHMKKVSGHRCYKKGERYEHWKALYMGDIEWTPYSKRGRDVTPAHTTVSLFWQELGERQSASFTVEDKHVRGRTVIEVLAGEGYVCETEELRTEYLKWHEHYVAISDKVGLQCFAVGIGVDDIDGNEQEDTSRRRWYGSNTFQMLRDGEPGRVVVDVPYETDGAKPHGSNDNFDDAFWRRSSFISDAEEEDDPTPEVEEDTAFEEESEPDEEIDEKALSEKGARAIRFKGGGVGDVEVPVYPRVPVFDLRRQMRMHIHAADLTVYKYDVDLGKKLVLPKESRELISILLHSRVEFTDVVKGKGNGAIVLTAGPPGVGKTMTSEVFAETEKRPLYSVQASQLGIDPTALEAALLRTFARAFRWNAILLIDEADVYVAKRGNDLVQNSIVGVFLRVLEYYQGVLFLTTNRADLVDDAIASRCVARLDYQLPSAEEQIQIWQILSKNAGVALDASVYLDIASKHRLSGRDVKQLLKLGSMVAKARKLPAITAEVIEFVRKFKPTQDLDAPKTTAKPTLVTGGETHW